MARKNRRDESILEEWLNKKVRELGGIARKWVSPDNPGVPDEIYIFPGGVIYFVELKTEIGRFSGLQKWQIGELQRLGCNVRKIKGLKQAEEFLAELEEEFGEKQRSRKA